MSDEEWWYGGPLNVNTDQLKEKVEENDNISSVYDRIDSCISFVVLILMYNYVKMYHNG